MAVELFQRRQGITTTVTAVSDGAGPGNRIFYHWYRDGVWQGATTTPDRKFSVMPGDQSRISAVDTTDPDFDPLASPPPGYPPKITVEFVRSLDENVRRYRVEFDSFAVYPTETIYVERAPRDQWAFRVTSPPIGIGVDVANISVRVFSEDDDGLPLGDESLTPNSFKHVPTPKAPAFAISFDEGTGRVTFTEAA